MMTYIIYYKINKCQGFGPAGEQEEKDLVSVTEPQQWRLLPGSVRNQEEKVIVSNYLELSAPAAESDYLFSLSSKPKTPLLAGSSRTKSAPSEKGARRGQENGAWKAAPRPSHEEIVDPLTAGSLVAFVLAMIRAKKWWNQMLNNL
jgi:hypothetical protein